MKNENYALWLLKNALRDELTYQQQAAQVINGDEGQYYPESAEAFRESWKIANERIPQLQKAITQLSGLALDKENK
jgi:hypothetical protein